MNTSNFNTPISLRNIKVTDSFWKKEMELVRNEVIPYQWEALNDRVPGADPSFCMKNFELAGKLNARKAADPSYVQPTWTTSIFNLVPEDMEHMEERFYGFVFQDTDFSKWIEAVAYSLTQHPDAELEAIADKAIDVVCAAQLENGYLDTFYIINDMSKMFTNLRDHHELYCFGHLTEGAVAYYEATGKDKLLKAACRFADFIDSYFGPEPEKCKGYPGHEIAEMALVRLYQATGNDRYLALSRFFVDIRGLRPYYYDFEVDHPYTEKGENPPMRYHYHQSHQPVREQREATGHSVRAVYLYSAMADLARLDQDEELLTACEALWDNMTQQKMYITGGIGATHLGEAFSFNYDLPNDTAYAETCASIGLIFFARRMLQISPDARYANVMERALYNGVLSGMALDGKSFFYVNPLEVLPEACHKDERKFHVKPVRQKWFGCACCPPNIARLLSSIASYAYTEKDDTLFAHLYIGSELTKEVNGEVVKLSITSGFPYEGTASFRFDTAASSAMTLALRLLDWTNAMDVTLNGTALLHLQNDNGCWTTADKASVSFEIKDGYLYLTNTWNAGDVIALSCPVVPKVIAANPAVREDIGKVAVTYGPLVYCIEEADNGTNLHLSEINAAAPVFEVKPDALFGAPVIIAAGRRRVASESNPTSGNASVTNAADSSKSAAYRSLLPQLYTTYQAPVYEDTTLTFVPYAYWNNRGEGEMSVWVKAM